MKELVENILKAVFVNNLSNEDKEIIAGAIDNTDETSHEKATFICDFVDIPRRGNRRVIVDMIDKYNEQHS